MSDLDLDGEAAWAAVEARDRTADGRFVTGVLSTGIYCRPSCAARHPKRANVRFFANGAAAAAAGLRPCRRCRPDEVAADSAAIARVVALIEHADAAPDLATMAAAAGYSRDHLLRLFRATLGVTPAAYWRALRARRIDAALAVGGRITDAIYDAGFTAPTRFYAEAPHRLGMTPSAWRDGGRGARIRWAITTTELGPLMIAATQRGLCRVAFDEDEAALKRRFPLADVEPGGAALLDLVERVVRTLKVPPARDPIPLDVRGTAFQEAVWRALAEVPRGETISYAALAARAGAPGAARAAGSACGANPVALVIPCHRALRAGGELGGYAWGLDRKQALLDRERDDPAHDSAATTPFNASGDRA